MRRDAEAVSTHETRSLPVEFSTDQMVMAFKEWFHELRKASDQREREGGRILQCFISSNIFQG